MRLTIITLLLLAFGLANPNTLSAQTKRAFLVGVSNFDASGWKQPLGSNNDLDVMSEVLVKQGFSRDNIMLLPDRQATLVGIRQGLERFSASLKPGDIAVVQFSTHGVQVEDFNGDEADGYDEAIVCYDSPYKDKDLAQSELGRFLLDDEVGVHLENLRKRLGPKGDLLVLMDFCHSGSSTRGGQGLVARGGYRPFTTTGYSPKGKPTDARETTLDAPVSRGEQGGLAPYVIFSASQAHQLDYERSLSDGRSVGALTYAMTRSLANAYSGITYEGLFSKISLVVQEASNNYGQLPVMEGPGAARQLLGGAFVAQQAWYPVKSIEKDGKTLILEGGELIGLTPGSEVLVCPSATVKADEELALAKGKLVSTTPFTSTLEADQSLLHKRAGDLWVFVTKKGVNLEKITLDFARANSRGMNDLKEIDAQSSKKLREKLSLLPNVGFGEQAELLIGGDPNRVEIWNNNSGKLMLTCRLDQIEQKIQGYSRYRTLQKLETEGYESMMSVEIIPYKPNTEEPDFQAIGRIFKNGVYEIPADKQMSYQVKITNLTNVKQYLNVLYLNNQAEIVCVIPGQNQTVDDCLILPSQSLKCNLNVTTAEGLETLKLILSPVRIDMRSVVDQSAFASRGAGDLSGIESIFGEIKNNTRAEFTPISKSAGAIGTFSFYSIEKQP